MLMKRKITKSRRRGLTLVEVMLALAISAMLMMAAMQVMAAASRCSVKSVVPDSGKRICTARLERLLRTEVENADGYRITKDGVFELKLRVGLDPDEITVKYDPSTVGYKTIDIGGRSWLVRTQAAGEDDWDELVAADVTKIAPETGDNAIEPDKWQSMPDIFVINIESGDKNKSAFEFILK